MSAVHLADPGKLHGIRCNHRGSAQRTHDMIRVSCSACIGLGYPTGPVPENATRTNTWLPITDIDGGENRPGLVLNLHNVIFAEGGSLFWFEEPDVLAVMHATKGGEVRRYQGTWESKHKIQSGGPVPVEPAPRGQKGET